MGKASGDSLPTEACLPEDTGRVDMMAASGDVRYGAEMYPVLRGRNGVRRLNLRRIAWATTEIHPAWPALAFQPPRRDGLTWCWTL
jgi:hypothetical protein